MAVDTLDLPKELEERFAGLAKMRGQTRNSLILAALEEWAEDQ